MGLKPEVSIGVALATAAIVGAVYINATPTITDIRAAPAQDGDVSATRKTAAWTSAGIVGAISLITRDANVFILGGGITIIMDWWVRHSNEVIPSIGKATVGAARAAVPSTTQAEAPASYGYSDEMAGIGY